MTTVKIQFRAEHLDKKDFFGLGKSDPYLIIEKKTGDSENATYQQIHKTEYIKNDCSPTWKPFHLTFEEENPDLKVKVYDWDKLSEHDFIGECETNLSDLLTGSEIKFECKKEKKTGKIKNAGTGSIILMYCRRAVGMKLSFRLNLETTTPKNLFLVVTERFQNGAKIDEEIYRTETIKTSSEGQGEWKLIETAVEDVKDTLQVQVFKSHQHTEPELFGDFLVELATLLDTEFEDRKFDLNRKGKKEKTGQVTLAMCKLCNLPTSVTRDFKSSNLNLRRAPPPPSTAPPPPPPPPPSTAPPPPPPPPSSVTKSQDHLQKTSNGSANPPQPTGPNMDEILKKKLKPVFRLEDRNARNIKTLDQKPVQANDEDSTHKMMDEMLKKKLRPVQAKGEDSTTGMMNEILKKNLKPIQSKGVETVESAPKPMLAKKPSMTNVLEIMRKAKGFEEEGNDESGEWDAEIQDLPPPPPLPATNPPKRMKLKDGPEMELSG